jgi:hypothetical protein
MMLKEVFVAVVCWDEKEREVDEEGGFCETYDQALSDLELMLIGTDDHRVYGVVEKRYFWDKD